MVLVDGEPRMDYRLRGDLPAKSGPWLCVQKRWTGSVACVERRCPEPVHGIMVIANREGRGSVEGGQRALRDGLPGTYGAELSY
jgi:hypothetical protein